VRDPPPVSTSVTTRPSARAMSVVVRGIVTPFSAARRQHHLPADQGPVGATVREEIQQDQSALFLGG